MRSPRRLALSDQVVDAHQLSLEPPLPDSIFWTMWNACTPLAEAALQTAFIQGIKAGTLDPTRYGAFNVNDAYYCYHSARDYMDAERRTDHPTLKMFLREKHNSYQKYNATFPSTWRVKDATGILIFMPRGLRATMSLTLGSLSGTSSTPIRGRIPVLSTHKEPFKFTPKQRLLR